jgi:hypothetical protein
MGEKEILVFIRASDWLISLLGGTGCCKNTLILRKGGATLNILLSSLLELTLISLPLFSCTTYSTFKFK